jgi:hypothetical protein
VVVPAAAQEAALVVLEAAAEKAAVEAEEGSNSSILNCCAHSLANPHADGTPTIPRSRLGSSI